MIDTVEVSRSHDSTDMGKVWMEKHPGLAVETLLRFLAEHPSDGWAITMRDAFMPGMHLTLTARRKVTP